MGRSKRYWKNYLVGRLGEILVGNYLVKKDYLLIELNWRTRKGELDIIAQKDDVLAFIEVKTRYNSEYNPMVNITDAKKKKMLFLASRYIELNAPRIKRRRIKTFRLDAATVNLKLIGSEILHIEGI